MFKFGNVGAYNEITVLHITVLGFLFDVGLLD